MELLDRLLAVGFLTGSRAFGTNWKDSDYDVVYSVEDSQKITDILGDAKRSPSDYFAGYFVKDGDKQINLIPVHPHDYLPWYLATKAMTATLKQSGIVDSVRKHSVFMGIVSLFKGTVERRGPVSAYASVKEEIAKRF